MDDIISTKVELKNKYGKDVEIFEASKPAQEAWDDLIGTSKKNGVRLDDETIRGTDLYKENVEWIKGHKANDSNILDLGAKEGKGKSINYEMERSILETE